mmetsp:Transcript_31938/g.73661  ORF Transcript_31938/g.73661 Transcript_31938/m.73661 type:complete len:270 (-) Transcript_31938:305-1114(-)
MVKTMVAHGDEEEPLLQSNTGSFVSSVPGVCMQLCGCCCCSLFTFLVWVLLMMMTTQCATRSSPVEHILPQNALADGVLPPFEAGTLNNMFLDPGLGLNLTGTWWMDGNELIWEQVVSFANAEGLVPYPTVVKNPSSLAGHWTWSDNFFGRGIMMYYAFISSAEATHDFYFQNSTYASIDAVSDTVFGADGSFPITYINDDEWARGNDYILRRIIYEDGTPHPRFWPKFINWFYSTFPAGKIVTSSSNSDCLRRCQYLAPCVLCKAICA